MAKEVLVGKNMFLRNTRKSHGCQNDCQSHLGVVCEEEFFPVGCNSPLLIVNSIFDFINIIDYALILHSFTQV